MGQHEDEAAEARAPSREVRMWLLAETVRLRDKFRLDWPESQRLPILEKDVLRQCRELGVPNV
jgi:hypothetical protein